MDKIAYTTGKCVREKYSSGAHGRDGRPGAQVVFSKQLAHVSLAPFTAHMLLQTQTHTDSYGVYQTQIAQLFHTIYAVHCFIDMHIQAHMGSRRLIIQQSLV